MAEFGDAFDELAQTENYLMAGMVLAGLAAAVVLGNVVDPRMDLPDEVYGVAVAAGGYIMGYDLAAIGGLSHTGLALAERVGVKATVENAGA